MAAGPEFHRRFGRLVIEPVPAWMVKLTDRGEATDWGPQDKREAIDPGQLQAEMAFAFRHSAAATIGGIAFALVLWLLCYERDGSFVVLAWAAWIHATQAVRLAIVLQFSRRPWHAAWPDPVRWLRRDRFTLLALALAWGAASPMLLPARHPSHAVLLTFALLCIAVTGISSIVRDRTSLLLWLLPVSIPIPLTLSWRSVGSTTYLATAVLALVIIAMSLRFALAQNRAGRVAMQAQMENAALVERLNEQIALTEQASIDKSRFLAAASHDLRQPLHALSFFGSTLERRIGQSAEQPLIFNMMRSIEALDNSFSAILDVSKLDAQAVEPHMQTFALRDLFRRLQMSFGGQAEAAGLQLRFNPGGRIVRSDPHLLERALANLVHNALKYCRQGGVVVVARSWRGGINVEVWDTGIGMAEAELPHIFSEFYQIANAERDRSKGLGIGLAIVSRLTRLLEHRLMVQSSFGHGSLFRIWLKGSDLLEEMGEIAMASETVPMPIDDAGTVLLLDDEEAIRVSVAEQLRHWGYTVLAVATIKEALSAATSHNTPIDIVISDLRLRNEEDGIHAIAAVRALCGHTVPAILVTGDTSPEQVRRIHESGHIALFKPVPPYELFNVLKGLHRSVTRMQAP